jgi:hypothetical protein
MYLARYCALLRQPCLFSRSRRASFPAVLRAHSEKLVPAGFTPHRGQLENAPEE